MDRFASMSAFTAVVEAGSFARGAQRRGLSTSSLSRLVADLEQHLGTRLLNRTTRRLSLTESGQAFFERCVHLLADLEEAEAVAALNAAAPEPRDLPAAQSSPTTFERKKDSKPKTIMQVELTEFEIDLLDKALVAWQHQPTQEGLTACLMGSMLRGMSEKDNPAAADEIANDVKKQRAESSELGRQRERQALFLRAKLEQVRQQSKVAAAFTPPS